ncbi:response regulator [Humisphaera borealis]|uniref:Response regulator n=1 Tax=Humisphaera borealis TaxID=2807512 RepID=A0A7M2WV99_9BACT|nr:response regulator [Humisphaera borealis]
MLKRTIRQTLFGRGRIVEASTGQEAIEVLGHHRVDLILIDPRLTDIDGVELIGRIRSEPETRGIPVVAMLARVDARKAEQLRRAGACAQLRKPFTAAAFGEVVSQVLEPTHV